VEADEGGENGGRRAGIGKGRTGSEGRSCIKGERRGNGKIKQGGIGESGGERSGVGGRVGRCIRKCGGDRGVRQKGG